jgi:hypothetical protein
MLSYPTWEQNRAYIGHAEKEMPRMISSVLYIYHLSGWWFGTCFFFHSVGNVIIPTDELIFFRGLGQPPTRSLLKPSLNHIIAIY